MNSPRWLSSGTGSEAIVFLHGMGSTAAVWLPQLEHFSQTHHCVAWTAPGYGGSPALADLSWSALAEQVVALLDRLNIKKAHIVGHSIGGMVAQMVYHLYPDRVQSLILSATSSGFGSQDPEFQRKFIAQREQALAQYPSFAEAAPSLLDGLTGPNAPELYKQLGVLAAQSISTEAYLAYMRLLLTFDQKAAFSRIKVPVLLLAGELDSQAPPKGMQRLVEQTNNAQIYVFNQVAHMANLEVADEFNQVISTFIASQGMTA